MLRVGEGKVDEAWEDLLACHRLARLVGQGPTLVEALVAIAIDGMACAGDQGLVQHARLTAGPGREDAGRPRQAAADAQDGRQDRRGRAVRVPGLRVDGRPGRARLRWTS